MKVKIHNLWNHIKQEQKYNSCFSLCLYWKQSKYFPVEFEREKRFYKILIGRHSIFFRNNLVLYISLFLLQIWIHWKNKFMIVLKIICFCIRHRIKIYYLIFKAWNLRLCNILVWNILFFITWNKRLWDSCLISIYIWLGEIFFSQI